MPRYKEKMNVGRADGKPFTIPAWYVTETATILGRRGSGKSYCGNVIAEELLECRHQVVIIDPTSAWWGLRSSADGKGEGYPILIFGGDHADLPLDDIAGPKIAELVVQNPSLSVILSLDHLSKTSQRKFVLGFAETLYHLKHSRGKQTPVHVFIDEGDLFAPQRIIKGMERLAGAVNDLVRRGRKYGIGVTLVTQRPAVINKDVLSQTEILIAGQVTGKHDRDAIREWIRYNADEDRQKEFLTSLALLQRGTLWVWSPGRLKVLVQLHVRKRKTFDSSATPDLRGKARKGAEPKRMSKVELKQVRSSLKSLVERSEENDPKALKREVAKLKKELSQVQSQPKGKVIVKAQAATPSVDGARIARKVEELHNDYLLNRVHAKVTDLFAVLKAKIGGTIRSSSLESIESGVLKLIERTAKALEGELKKPIKVPDLLGQSGVIPRKSDKKQGPSVGVKVLLSGPRPEPRPKEPVAFQGEASDVKVSKCERAVLTVLAQRSKPCSKRLVSLHAGYSIKSGSFSNSLSSLRMAGLIVGSGSGPLEITEQGLTVVGDYDPLPTGQELIEYWAQVLGRCERSILRTVAESHPEPLTKEQIAESAGYIVSSGSFSNSISKLRGLELIQGKGREPIRLSDEVFE